MLLSNFLLLKVTLGLTLGCFTGRFVVSLSTVSKAWRTFQESDREPGVLSPVLTVWYGELWICHRILELGGPPLCFLQMRQTFTLSTCDKLRSVWISH